MLGTYPTLAVMSGNEKGGVRTPQLVFSTKGVEPFPEKAMRILRWLLLSLPVLVALFGQEHRQAFSVAASSALTMLQPSAATPQQTEAGRLHRGQTGQVRGYLTTPQELHQIRKKAAQGLQPYHDAVEVVLAWAAHRWQYPLAAEQGCASADQPAWSDDGEGIPRLYAKALAYHLIEDRERAEGYAQEVKTILAAIMTEVGTITLDDQQCQLNFGWSTPELIAAADLIEPYWAQQRCQGPTSTRYGETALGRGHCKRLFQNWLVKNPYYVVSYAAVSSQSNWGAAATNTTAYIADYLWDRPEARLVHRHPPQINEGRERLLTPAQAYAYANLLMFKRINGYGVDYHSSMACDRFAREQQSAQWPMTKSQITPNGIIPEDARRSEACNIPQYNGSYQNYPQIHLGNNLQQCELMLRRGDQSCYDNIDHSEHPYYRFINADGDVLTTHLYPGRGSLERAIKAIIVDSETPWRHDAALAVAYRYYYRHHRLEGFAAWAAYVGEPDDCSQDICFGTLTHGFAATERPLLPPAIAPPSSADGS
jgi:hypothetical protein